MNCFYAYVSPRQGAQVFAHFDTVFTGWQYIVLIFMVFN